MGHPRKDAQKASDANAQPGFVALILATLVGSSGVQERFLAEDQVLDA